MVMVSIWMELVILSCDVDGNRISFDGTNVQLIADKFFLGGDNLSVV